MRWNELLSIILAVAASPLRFVSKSAGAEENTTPQPSFGFKKIVYVCVIPWF